MSLPHRPDRIPAEAGEPGALSAPGFFYALPPLALYVHLPWCERKCPYCDFNSFELSGAVPDDVYVDALLRDLDAELTSLAAGPTRPLLSIFIGGGTPSLFSGSAIRRLLDGIRSRVGLTADCEITLEANPGAVEAARFEDYAEAGVTRLSIGVQSLRDDPLRALGRIHSSADARRAVALARSAGFANINLDLMYGLPGDDVAGALADLGAAIALDTAHVSWYQLTLEPGTAFHRRPPPLPDEDRIAGIEEAGRDLLAAAGFRRYEISAYARDGRQAQHNLNYWHFGDYIGIGAGAHGKLTAGSGIVRTTKRRNPRSYLDSSGEPAATTREAITEPDRLIVEFMMNALRLIDGVDTRLFELRTGRRRAEIAAARAKAERLGWLCSDPGVLTATPAGRELLNRLIGLF